MLARSKGAPLRVRIFGYQCIHIDDDTSDGHATRLQEFHVFADSTALSRYLRCFPQEPTPLLLSLQIKTSSGILVAIPRHVLLLAKPTLQSLSLEDCQVPWEVMLQWDYNSSLANLVSLRLARNEPRPPAKLLLNMLTYSKNLKIVYLEHALPCEDLVFPLPNPSDIRPFITLEDVDIADHAQCAARSARLISRISPLPGKRLRMRIDAYTTNAPTLRTQPLWQRDPNLEEQDIVHEFLAAMGFLAEPPSFGRLQVSTMTFNISDRIVSICWEGDTFFLRLKCTESRTPLILRSLCDPAHLRSLEVHLCNTVPPSLEMAMMIYAGQPVNITSREWNSFFSAS